MSRNSTARNKARRNRAQRIAEGFKPRKVEDGQATWRKAMFEHEERARIHLAMNPPQVSLMDMVPAPEPPAPAAKKRKRLRRNAEFAARCEAKHGGRAAAALVVQRIP